MKSRKSCIFCEISSGKARASFVHQDRRVFAITSLDQPNPYKVLVIPRKHVESIFELDGKLAGLVFQQTVRIARAVRDVSGCDGLNLLQSNGVINGGGVPHFHIHLIPRFTGDKIKIDWKRVKVSRRRLDNLSAKLRARLEE
jgi:histidine triad (HIT) family protein